jgi:ankyrin repeat protein
MLDTPHLAKKLDPEQHQILKIAYTLRQGSAKEIKAEIKNIKNLTAINFHGNFTFLHLLAENKSTGIPEIIDDLLRYRCQFPEKIIEAKTISTQQTPLLLAAKEGNLVVMKKLICYAANREVTDYDGRNVIKTLMESGYGHLIKAYKDLLNPPSVELKSSTLDLLSTQF